MPVLWNDYATHSTIHSLDTHIHPPCYTSTLFSAHPPSVPHIHPHATYPPPCHISTPYHRSTPMPHYPHSDRQKVAMFTSNSSSVNLRSQRSTMRTAWGPGVQVATLLAISRCTSSFVLWVSHTPGVSVTCREQQDWHAKQISQKWLALHFLLRLVGFKGNIWEASGRQGGAYNYGLFRVPRYHLELK